MEGREGSINDESPWNMSLKVEKGVCDSSVCIYDEMASGAAGSKVLL